MFYGVVSGVEVVRICGEFSCDSVDLFDKRRDTSLKAKSADSKLCRANAIGELTVRETILLRVPEEVDWQVDDIAGP